METEGISIEQEKAIVKEVMKPISIYVIINLIASIIFVYDSLFLFILFAINFCIGLINICLVSEKKARKNLEKAKMRINAYILGRFAFILWLFILPTLPMGRMCMCGYRAMNIQPLILYFTVYISVMMIFIKIMKSGKNKMAKIDVLGVMAMVISFFLVVIVNGYNATFPNPHML